MLGHNDISALSREQKYIKHMLYGDTSASTLTFHYV